MTAKLRADPPPLNLVGMTTREEALEQLLAFARDYRNETIAVRQAVGAFDERLDGEPVTRLTLLLDDPDDDTWNLDGLRKLRSDVGRHGTSLQLPTVALTLVAKSEAAAVDALAA